MIGHCHCALVAPWKTEPKNRVVEPWAFLAALPLAPFTIGIPTILFCWLAIELTDPSLAFVAIASIPTAAMHIGAPTYLLFGGPAFWFAIQKHSSIPGAAFLANMISLPFVAAYVGLNGGEPLMAMTLFAIFGSIFAPLWGAIFAILYNRFAEEDVV